jgi:hypothetical protein
MIERTRIQDRVWGLTGGAPRHCFGCGAYLGLCGEPVEVEPGLYRWFCQRCEQELGQRIDELTEDATEIADMIERRRRRPDDLEELEREWALVDDDGRGI